MVSFLGFRHPQPFLVCQSGLVSIIDLTVHDTLHSAEVSSIADSRAGDTRPFFMTSTPSPRVSLRQRNPSLVQP